MRLESLSLDPSSESKLADTILELSKASVLGLLNNYVDIIKTVKTN